MPQEVIKQRLVTGIYPNFAAAVQTIYATEGIRGFYAAWLPTVRRAVWPFASIPHPHPRPRPRPRPRPHPHPAQVSRNVPFVAITFTSFAALQRRRLSERGEEGRPEPQPRTPNPNPEPEPRTRTLNPNPEPEP